jgi:4-amino-4-deoxy-L-arabinose transferase-like glycosyltransferase
MEISSGNLTGISLGSARLSRARELFTRTTVIFVLLLVALCAARLATMAVFPMSDTTEPRYAETSRLMLVKDDWITLWYTPEQPFWGKPPLAFWAQAVAMKVLGINDFAARLPSFLAVVATLYLTMRLGRQMGGIRLARKSGLVFASMALTYVSAGTVMTDAILALGTTLCLVSVTLMLEGQTKPWRWLFFLGLAIGLLAKGPVSLILVSIPLFGWGIWTGRWRILATGLPWGLGILLTLGLAGPWYVLAEMKTPGFLEYFVLGEHVYRFIESGWAGNLYGSAHDRPRGAIWLFLLLASLPWSLIGLFILLRALFTERQFISRIGVAMGDPMRLVVLAAFAPALFFTLAGNILWAYVLPGLPFLAIILARGLTWSAPGIMRQRFVIACITPVTLTLAGLYLTWQPQHLPSQYSLLNHFYQEADAKDDNLYYLDPLPFSARYYSRNTARAVPRDQLDTLLQSHRTIFLAVRQRDLDQVRAVLGGTNTAIYTDRRYQLFRLPPSTSAIANLRE